jgi:hypothetical protein
MPRRARKLNYRVASVPLFESEDEAREALLGVIRGMSQRRLAEFLEGLQKFPTTTVEEVGISSKPTKRRKPE